MGDSKRVWQAVLASLAIHLLLVVLLPGLQPSRPRAAETRVRVALQPPAGGTFTETPPSARIPEAPPDATHLAEHAARAQNPEAADGRSPRSGGDIDLFDFRPSDLMTVDARQRQAAASPPRPEAPVSPPAPVAEPTENARAFSESGRPAGEVADREARRDTDAETVTEADAPGATGVPPAFQPGGDRARSRRDVTGVRATGEMSLSTYAWTWAPYLRHLRDAIDARWQPPLAFYMGLIEGDGAIHFRVERDGTVSVVDVVTEVGHPSLARAARLAVENAVPFNALPADFPDPHLDVTWQYRYILLRR